MLFAHACTRRAVQQILAISLLFTLVDIAAAANGIVGWPLHLLSGTSVAVISCVVIMRFTHAVLKQRESWSNTDADFGAAVAEGRKLALIASKTDNSIFITDSTGHVEWINDSFSRLYALTLKEVKGELFASLLTGPESDPKATELMWNQLRKAERIELEMPVYASTGRKLWVHRQVQPIFNDAGSLVNFLCIDRDETQRRYMVDALRSSEERNRSIVETALDAVITIDNHAMITGWNPRAEQIFGWQRRELLFKPLAPHVFAKHAREEVLTCLRELLRATQGQTVTRRVESVGASRDGREFPVEVSASRTAYGDRVRVALFVRDIATQKQAETDLKNAIIAAEAANQAKSDFLANMSHEIRTPLNGVLGTVDLLMATRLADEQRKFAELAKTSADALLTLINDVLDISKIEAGKLDLSPIDFDLAEAIRNTTNVILPRVEKKKLLLHTHIAPNLPRRVHGDPDRLRQVLLNLIGNAVKFTERGSITVDVSAGEQTADKLTLLVNVTDTGIGIPPERMDRLFKVFSQVDASTTRKYGGTGLGLAICKQLVELMGGKISVQSEEGRGTTFSFHITLKIPSQAAVAAAPATPSAADEETAASHGHILLAEDNDINQLVAENILTNAGFTCEIVCNGAEALQAVQTKTYSAVLMDCQMPVLSGFDATRAIRQWEKKQGRPRMPIVALTANAIKGDREKCLEAGMTEYLTKPLDPKKLIQVLEELTVAAV